MRVNIIQILIIGFIVLFSFCPPKDEDQKGQASKGNNKPIPTKKCHLIKTVRTKSAVVSLTTGCFGGDRTTRHVVAIFNRHNTKRASYDIYVWARANISEAKRLVPVIKFNTFIDGRAVVMLILEVKKEDMPVNNDSAVVPKHRRPFAW